MTLHALNQCGWNFFHIEEEQEDQGFHSQFHHQRYCHMVEIGDPPTNHSYLKKINIYIKKLLINAYIRIRILTDIQLKLAQKPSQRDSIFFKASSEP